MAHGNHLPFTTLDCDACPVMGPACADCPVNFLLSREPDDAVVYDHSTERALRLLRDGGLLGEIVEDVRLTKTG